MQKIRNKKIVVLGAGKVGSTVADMLAEHHGAETISADISFPVASHVDPLVKRVLIDVTNTEALEKLIRGNDFVINALPFYLAKTVAEVAVQCGSHYLDLTEDVQATTAIRALAKSANTVLMPQCGLAPGVIGVLGGALSQNFEELFDLRLRVGALTRNVTNSLRYNFTWSIDGVINEYCNPCEAIVQGNLTQVQPLEGYETFSLDAEEFEAFNTSGGLGTLSESLVGKVRNLDYKTIRYPGHRDAMKFLLNDLRLVERRDLLREVLELAIPHSREDVVIIFGSASGKSGGRFEQSTRLARIYGSTLRGVPRTAIELTTAAGVTGALELLVSDQLPAKGFIGQEQIRLADFLATRAGHYYADLANSTMSAAMASVPN